MQETNPSKHKISTAPRLAEQWMAEIKIEILSKENQLRRRVTHSSLSGSPMMSTSPSKRKGIK